MPAILGKRASAGAGKTFALAVKYINLLHSLGEPSPEILRQIIAITFTNKAAAEMRERILQFLKEISFQTEFYQNHLKKEVELPPEKASSWMEIILSYYFDFHVRTIDSLLVAILKGLSFELGIKPELKVLFKESEILNEAFDVLLSYLSDSKKRKTFQEIWKKVLNAFLTHDERGGFYPENKLRKRIIKDIYPKLKGEIPEPFFSPEEKKKEIDEAFKELKEAYKLLYEFLITYKSASKIKILTYPNPEEINPSFFQKIRYTKTLMEKEGKALFKRPKRNLKVPSKNEIERFERKILSKFREKYQNWLKKCQEFTYLKLLDYYELLKNLKTFAEEISKEEGLLLGSKHWTDLILEVMRQEEIPSLIYAHFAGKFGYFLFDEFQDTSLEQWEALSPLFEDVLSSSEKASFFIVGDPKQAIYGWRGGDWKIYQKIFTERKIFPCLEETSIKEEIIKENYRSHPELVEFFNLVFKDFADEEKIWKENIPQFCLGTNAPEIVKKEFCKDLAEAFKDCAQISARLDAIDQENRIKIFVPSEEKASRDEVKEAIKQRFLKEISEEWEKTKDLVEDTPIAVLVRTNEIGEEISSWLIEKGIPVVTENALSIGISPVVRGIISLLYLLLDREKELYYYGFLTSGLLLNGFQNEDELVSIWLDELQKKELKTTVLELVEKIDSKLLNWDPYQLIWIILDELNLEKRLKEDLAAHKPFVDRLLEITHQFVLEEGPNLIKFLNFWERGGVEAKVGLPENIKAVRVLTIHKAKGLEFPVVFIPFTDWVVYNRSPIDVVCYKGEKSRKCLVHLKEPLPEELTLHKYRLIAKQMQEEIHLFYVALTRAKEKLYLFFPIYDTKGIVLLSKWMKNWVKKAINSLKKEYFYEIPLPTHKN